MGERQPTPRDGAAREGKETAWLFFRTLLGLLLVAWLVPALFVPPRPLAFLVAMAALWLVATVVAWWLVFQGGYERLRDSDRYAPGLPHARALVLFAVIALALKFVGTVAVDQYVSGLPGYEFVDPRAAAGGGGGDFPVNTGTPNGTAANGTATATDAAAANGTATATATASTPTGTAAGDAAAGEGGAMTAVRDRPYVYDFAVSVVALAVAYGSVYTGKLAWLLGEE